MVKKNLNYSQYAAFINREEQLDYLKKIIDKEPSEILFLHGPKSSGKTTLLYKFIEPKDDVMEWLLNLEKYSKIKDYTLTPEDVEKIWEMVEGSMWEIQDILSELFTKPLDKVISFYKQKMLGLLTDYIVTKGRKERERILKHFKNNNKLFKKDIGEDDEELLRDMVRNNILYFDPTEAIYYPQGKSYHWGMKLYFESI